ncbi:hypothetical protein KA037_06000 [Patescibacteria group bacterium]|nr:hypothetical protein [Patescibacteria group bacterium]
MNYDIEAEYGLNNGKIVNKSSVAGELTTKELIGSLSEDITLTSFELVQNVFKDKDLASVHEKKSLLEELWLYADDGDENDEFKKYILEILTPVRHRLSDGDVEAVFPKIYALLFPENIN